MNKYMSYNGEKPLSVNVQIQSIEDKERSIKIKADKSYSFFKFKKDGNKTVAYSTFETMGIKSGDTVNLSYVREPFTLPDGKQATANKVIGFREAGGSPVDVKKARTEPNIASQGQSEVNWDKLGYAKTLTNWTAELLGQGSPSVEIHGFIQNEAWDLWQAISDEADRRFSPHQLAYAQKKKELREIEQQEEAPLLKYPGDDVDVDEIPF